MATTKHEEQTIAAIALKRYEEHPGQPYLISRFDDTGKKTPDRLHHVTLGRARRIIWDFMKGLWEMGFDAFDRLGVMGPNRPRWIYACMAAILSRGVHVPIYPTSKDKDVEWILGDSGATFVVCGSMEHAGKVLAVKDGLDALRKIILMDPLPEKHDAFIMSFDEVVDKGQGGRFTDDDIAARLGEVMEEDMASIIYTSGTTGRPKGVMLTHRNFVAQTVVLPEFDFQDGEVFLAHLPMCHSFGFSSDLLASANVGGTLFVADSIETEEMRKNLKDCRPTVMSSVPRLWEKLYIRIGQVLASRPPAVRKLFAWAIEVGKEAAALRKQRKPIPLSMRVKLKIAGRLFRRVKTEIGLDRLKYCFTGGGPIDAKLIDLFGAMDIHLFQGYGLTETAPIVFSSTPRHNRIGTVGRPCSNVEVKIADDGEILIRAPQVMKGYYNNPEATAEVLSDDGWFATGDIGEIDEDGYLKITDRKKELFITSGGKNIPPQPIENEFNTDPYIEMACAIGDGRKFISALIVPEFQNVRAWLEEKQGSAPGSDEELARHPAVKELIEERVALVNERLARYERIRKYIIMSHLFGEATGELTPTQKRKRRVILEKYADEIEGMYKDL